jgi:hypothetical protein
MVTVVTSKWSVPFIFSINGGLRDAYMLFVEGKWVRALEVLMGALDVHALEGVCLVEGNPVLCV